MITIKASDLPRAPDWPPRGSARNIADGTLRRGSTGQLFEARGGIWVRMPDDPKHPDDARTLG